MGNQARMMAKFTEVPTSTRNFPNRLGQGAKVYSDIAAILGRLPAKAEHRERYETIMKKKDTIYRYFNFDQYDDCKPKDDTANVDTEERDTAKFLRVICCMSLFILGAARPTDVHALFDWHGLLICYLMVQFKRAGEDHEKQNKEFQMEVADQRETRKLLTAAISVLQDFYGKKVPCRATTSSR